MEPHVVLEENAGKIAEWLKTRGGLAVWPSIDLSDPGKSWTGPLNDTNGKPATKPTWKAADAPSRLITDPAEVVVDVPREVKRFRVGVRTGSQGMTLKVTDGGTARIRREVAKAGDDAWYEFDYSTQEAVIYVPASRVPLIEWLAKQESAS